MKILILGAGRVGSSLAEMLVVDKRDVTVVDTDIDVSFKKIDSYCQLDMVNFANDVLPSYDEIHQVLNSVRSGPISTLKLISQFPKTRQPFLFRSLNWFLKMGVLRQTDCQRTCL